MTRLRTLKYWPLVSFLLIAAASAADVSLGSIQMLTGSIPTSCLRVYNAPIPGCKAEELNAGRCSEACVRGLSTMEQNIQRACDDVFVTSNSILGQALRGNLVERLCVDESSPEGPTETPQPSQPSSTGNGGGTSTSVAGVPSQNPINFPSAQTPPPVAVIPPPPEAQSTRTTQQQGRPVPTPANGAGGSPFDIVAGGAGTRFSAGLAARSLVLAGLGFILLR